jgi:ribosomal protein L15E
MHPWPSCGAAYRYASIRSLGYYWTLDDCSQHYLHAMLVDEHAPLAIAWRCASIRSLGYYWTLHDCSQHYLHAMLVGEHAPLAL